MAINATTTNVNLPQLSKTRRAKMTRRRREPVGIRSSPAAPPTASPAATGRTTLAAMIAKARPR